MIVLSILQSTYIYCCDSHCAMDKRQIEMILTIERFANITKAADYLGITQPTLSKFLKNTEDKFNTQIFYRFSKELKTTEEGDILLTSFRNIYNEYLLSEQRITDLREGYINQIKIGTHEILGRYFIPKIEAQTKNEKNINLHYTFKNSRNITEDIVNGELDFGIVADPQKYPDLIIRPLWKEYIGLYSKTGKIEDTILYNSNMIFFNKLLRNIEYKNAKVIDDYGIIYSMLKQTNYMGFLPNPIAESESKLKLIEKFKPNIEICLIYNASKLKNSSSKSLIKTITTMFKNIH